MKKGDVFKVVERHKVLILVLERRITQVEAARELRLSLSHTKKLIRRLKEARGSYQSLFYQRTHPAPNRLSEDIRDKVIALKRENRGRSNPLIADFLSEEIGVRIHIHQGKKMRVWHKDQFLCDLPHVRKEEKDKRYTMFFDPRPRVHSSLWAKGIISMCANLGACQR